MIGQMLFSNHWNHQMIGSRPFLDHWNQNRVEWILFGLWGARVRGDELVRAYNIYKGCHFVLFLHFSFDCPIHCLCNEGLLLLRVFATD